MSIGKGIDPNTGKYLPARINHLGNAVYIRLATPLGSWWAALRPWLVPAWDMKAEENDDSEAL